MDADERQLVHTYKFPDVELGVFEYPRTEATAALLNRAAFKSCGAWLVGKTAALRGYVFVCELQPGGAVATKAPCTWRGGSDDDAMGDAPTRVILGYIAFEYRGRDEVHVHFLCGFIDGLCVGTVLMHAVAHHAVGWGTKQLTLKALPGAMRFYGRYRPETAETDENFLTPCVWRDVAVLADALLAHLHTCTPKVVGAVYAVYLVWLAFLNTSAGRRTLCVIRSTDSLYEFDGREFLRTIAGCPAFDAFLRACIPAYHDDVVKEVADRAQRMGVVFAVESWMTSRPVDPRLAPPTRPTPKHAAGWGGPGKPVRGLDTAAFRLPPGDDAEPRAGCSAADLLDLGSVPSRVHARRRDRDRATDRDRDRDRRDLARRDLARRDRDWRDLARGFETRRPPP
jgi:hypothetical protein